MEEQKPVKKQLIFQDNAITTARYSMSALEKNIMYMVMAQLGKNDPADRYYRIVAKDLMQRTNKEIRYAEFKEATSRLREREITILKDNGNILQIGLISSAEYIQGAGVIEIGLDPKIRPYIFELKENFTSFELNMALSLNSKFSKRLYEMLAQFRSTGVLRISVLELKERLKLVDSKTGEEQYEKWSAFEKYVIKVAQKELEKHTDITFDYKLKKTGKRFTDITFSIKQKKIVAEGVINPEIIPNTEGVVLVAKGSEGAARIKERLTLDFRLRHDQAEEIVQKFSAQEINRTLYDINLKMKSNEINNIGAYTAKTFGL
jgi:plasmid replication initiation protein